MQWIPDGPHQLEVIPFGVLFVWHNWDTERVRGSFSGVVNDIRYNRGSRSWDGWEAVFTFNNFIFPSGRSEYVEGRRITGVELQWNYFFAGFGIGYRTRSEEHTSELQSLAYLVCRLLLEKKKKTPSRRSLLSLFPAKCN